MKIKKHKILAAALFCSLHLAGQAPVEHDFPNVWEAELSASTVSASQMQSFHQRAGQKLRDFADLLSLIADPTMDEALRQESKAAALGLFADKSSSIHWHGLPKKDGGQLPLESLLAQIGKSASGAQFGISNFKGTPPNGCQRFNCAWDVSFYLVEKMPNGSTQQYHATMTVWLKKAKKRFGNTEKESWEVFLGAVTEMGKVGVKN